jgi:L-ascorbate metabolism protein UlaG (beta-lactamase superfamily)
MTKFGHACVRVEHDGQALVLDPGGWTEPEAVDGATAVLITHEHADHLSLDHLRRTDAPVFTIEAVARQIAEQDPAVAERVTVVAPGEDFEAGLPVSVVGELHAVIHPDQPRFANSGFLMTVGDLRVYHPGDAFTEPGSRVDVLLVPVHAPWSKTAEVIDFARAVGAPRSVAIHDGLLNDQGLALAQRLVGGMLEATGQRYDRVAPGSDI